MPLLQLKLAGKERTDHERRARIIHKFKTAQFKRTQKKAVASAFMFSALQMAEMGKGKKGLGGLTALTKKQA